VVGQPGTAVLRQHVGRARGLIDVVHSFCNYDVVVDTGRANVDACVGEILASLTSAQGESRCVACPNG
jgi:hypothetical protein